MPPKRVLMSPPCSGVAVQYDTGVKQRTYGDDGDLFVAVAHPLPLHWPTLHLPVAKLVEAPHLPLASAQEIEDAKIAETRSWGQQEYASATNAATPTKKRGKARTAANQRMQMKEVANQQGTLCKCGKLDTDKYMLQCDGCDVWYHGECVGLTQDQCIRARSWRCRPCTKRHVAAQARSNTYCICKGPWDGRSFMIQCDKCKIWFHGACIGYQLDSVQRCTEAAFRRYHCPLCVQHSSANMSHPASVPDASSSASKAFESSFHPLIGLNQSCLEHKHGHDAVGSPAASDPLAGGISVISDDGGQCAKPVAVTRCLLLDILSDDEFTSIFSLFMSISSLLISVAPCCHRLASLAEPCFRIFCQQNGWRPPRRIRDHPFAWRLLVRQRACAVCVAPQAYFPVRRNAGGAFGGGSPLFRLCRHCARREKVQQQITFHGLEVDAIDEQGRPLFARQFHTPLFGHTNGFSTSLETAVNRNGL